MKQRRAIENISVGQCLAPAKSASPYVSALVQQLPASMGMSVSIGSGRSPSGPGDHWHDKVLTVDFVVIENTLGKFGRKTVQFNQVPNDCQPLVGNGHR